MSSLGNPPPFPPFLFRFRRQLVSPQFLQPSAFVRNPPFILPLLFHHTAPSKLVSPGFHSVISSLPSSVSATIPALTNGFPVEHLPHTIVVAPPQTSTPPAAPSTVEPLVALEPVVSSTPPCGLVIAIMRKRLALQGAAFTELDEASLAGEDLFLKSSVAKSTLDEANLHSQVSALQTDSTATVANVTASQGSIVTASFEIVELCVDNRCSISHVLDLTSTANSLRLQLSNS